MTAEDFVRARLAEHSLPEPVSETFHGLLCLADAIQENGNTNDTLSWITGAPTHRIAEYVLGIDPASDATRIRRELVGWLASTWKEHESFDPEWRSGR